MVGSCPYNALAPARVGAASDEVSPTEALLDINIIRSARRKRTVSARWANGGIEILAPAGMRDSDLNPIVDKLRDRLEKRKARRKLNDDQSLRKRAEELNQRYFRGRLKIECIEYVTNQTRRFGSCTPWQGHIRLSLRVGSLPDWVRDYVIMHELAHLLEANHGPRFWKLVSAYPLGERARGYLMALDMEADDLDGEEGPEGAEGTAG